MAPTPAAIVTELATASLPAEDALLTLHVEGSFAAGGGNAERHKDPLRPRGLEPGRFRLVPCCCPLRAFFFRERCPRRAVVAGAQAGPAAGQLPWLGPHCQMVWLIDEQTDGMVV
jgi:hypothetical protein